MGRKKDNLKYVTMTNVRSKDTFLANLNLRHQPVVCLTKLNIPNCNETNFVVNVNSKQFKQLVNKENSFKSKSKMQSPKTFKRKKRKNKKQSLTVSKSDPLHSDGKTDKGILASKNLESRNDIFMHESNMPNNNSDSQSRSGSNDNSWSLEFWPEDTEESTNYEDIPAESITRTDKVIDTFLSVMRKSTDDYSILSALQRDYICGICQRGFLNKATLRKHVLLCMGMKKPKREKKEGSHPCPMCGITYLNKYSLDKHNANVHNLKKMYKCLVCSQHFYNEEALTLHCRSRHGLGGSDIYKCPYCEASFNLRGNLNMHCRNAHNTTQYYICSMCLECFKNEDTCKLHEQSHGYCCEVCMFKTKSEDEMAAHKLTHLYMVVHKCDKCLRTFKAKRDFTKHIKVHEREKKLLK